jgi:hypothetical protein
MHYMEGVGMGGAAHVTVYHPGDTRFGWSLN